MYIKSVGADASDIIDRQKPTCSHEQAMYCDPQIFQLDLEHVIAKQWQLVDHESRIPHRGDYFLFEVGDESIIIIRGQDDTVYAHYNVCRHRGSRICLEKEGKANLMVCPYHSWSYRQDGTLANAPYMAEDFDGASVALKSCHVRICEGLIFICLAENPPDFHANIEGLEPFFKLHGTASCKIAYRHTFDTLANWKLVVENYIECYHCLAAHPELCSLRTQELIVNFGAGPASSDADAAGGSPEMKAFEERATALGQLPPEVDDTHGHQWFRFGHRAWFRDGVMSESEDGQPMAPLLKGYKNRDMGYCGVGINPVSHMLATNDAVFLFRFTPRAPTKTDAEIIWLVNADAQEGKDYDLERLTWMWRTTAKQDLTITQNNQLGINSRAYVPHQHSLMESNVTEFCRWYLENLRDGVCSKT